MPLGENHITKKDVLGFTPNNPDTRRNMINIGVLYKDFAGGSSDIDDVSGTRSFPNDPEDYLSTEHAISGTSVKIQVDEAGGDTLLRFGFDDLPDLTQHTHMDLWVFDTSADPDSDLDSNFKLTVRLGMDTKYTLTNRYEFILNEGAKDTVKKYSENPAWKCIRVPLRISSVSGDGFNTTNGTGHAGDFSDVTFMQLEFRTEAADVGSCDMWLDSIYFDQKAKPKIMFTFDDGGLTDYTEGYDYLVGTKGLTGTSFIYSEGIDGATTMSANQCREMKLNRWDFGNHSSDALNLTTDIGNDVDVAMSKLNTCDQYLRDQGLGGGGKHVAFVQGEYSIDLIAAMRTAGYTFGRLVTAGAGSSPHIEGHPERRSLYGFDPLLTKCIRADTSTISGGDISSITDAIDNTRDYGGFGVIMLHKIMENDDAVSATEINRTDFRAIVDYCYTLDKAGDIEVVNVSQAMGSVARFKLKLGLV